ncbi:hypothetical protein HSB1_30730 [Halogranum salarium B-1]|uniref:Uncharacterized protein n=1 Tax=Halogranum salarium B-1 TaxID=1210908 RepID=J2ZD39_9EURY|nr:hypothetical protein HSB1_30730 [Halogranum salarium B-1]
MPPPAVVHYHQLDVAPSEGHLSCSETDPTPLTPPLLRAETRASTLDTVTPHTPTIERKRRQG